MFTVAEIEKEVAKAKAEAKTETVSKLGELRAELVRHIDCGLEAAAQQLEAVRQEVTQQAAQLESLAEGVEQGRVDLVRAVVRINNSNRPQREKVQALEEQVEVMKRETPTIAEVEAAKAEGRATQQLLTDLISDLSNQMASRDDLVLLRTRVEEGLRGVSEANIKRFLNLDLDLHKSDRVLQNDLNALRDQQNRAMAELENLHRMVAYEHDQLAQLQG